MKINWSKVEIVDDKGDRTFKFKCEETGREFVTRDMNHVGTLKKEYERAFSWFQEFCAVFKVTTVRDL